MKPRLTLERATEVHARELLRIGMRKADVREVEASGHAPDAGLLRSVEVSDPETLTAVLLDDQVACIYGVHPQGRVQFMDGHRRRIGIVWMLGTHLVGLHARQVARHALNHKALARLHRKYPILFNDIHAHNDVALRFARWLGATISKPRSLGKPLGDKPPEAFCRAVFLRPDHPEDPECA